MCGFRGESSIQTSMQPDKAWTWSHSPPAVAATAADALPLLCSGAGGGGCAAAPLQHLPVRHRVSLHLGGICVLHMLLRQGLKGGKAHLSSACAGCGRHAVEQRCSHRQGAGCNCKQGHMYWILHISMQQQDGCAANTAQNSNPLNTSALKNSQACCRSLPPPRGSRGPAPVPAPAHSGPCLPAGGSCVFGWLMNW